MIPCCHVWRSQSANGLPGPDTGGVQKLFVRGGGGPGVGTPGPGSFSGHWLCYLPAYPVWSGPGTTPGHCQHQDQSRLGKYIGHKNVTSSSTSRCKLSIVYWINIGPYFGFQSCSYYQYLMMLVTQNNRWHADYTGGWTNTVLKGTGGYLMTRLYRYLQIFIIFSWSVTRSDRDSVHREAEEPVVISANDHWTLDQGWNN